jgi:hypothetical protein
MDQKIIMFGLCIFLSFGCLSQEDSSDVDTSTAITRDMCEQYGGNWVSYCECGGIAGYSCPPGSLCTDYEPDAQTPDAIGKCKKVSE